MMVIRTRITRAANGGWLPLSSQPPFVTNWCCINASPAVHRQIGGWSMGKQQIRLEVIRRESIDRQRLVRALIDAVRARQRQRAAAERPENNVRGARGE